MSDFLPYLLITTYFTDPFILSKFCRESTQSWKACVR